MNDEDDTELADTIIQVVEVLPILIMIVITMIRGNEWVLQ